MDEGKHSWTKVAICLKSKGQEIKGGGTQFSGCSSMDSKNAGTFWTRHDLKQKEGSLLLPRHQRKFERFLDHPLVSGRDYTTGM